MAILMFGLGRNKTLLEFSTSDKKCLNQASSLGSVLEMFVFSQLISRPKLTFLMKSGYVGVV